MREHGRGTDSGAIAWHGLPDCASFGHLLTSSSSAHCTRCPPFLTRRTAGGSSARVRPLFSDDGKGALGWSSGRSSCSHVLEAGLILATWPYALLWWEHGSSPQPSNRLSLVESSVLKSRVPQVHSSLWRVSFGNLSAFIQPAPPPLAPKLAQRTPTQPPTPANQPHSPNPPPPPPRSPPLPQLSHADPSSGVLDDHDLVLRAPRSREQLVLRVHHPDLLPLLIASTTAARPAVLGRPRFLGSAPTERETGPTCPRHLKGPS